MPVLRIWKKYDNTSNVNGVVVEDRVPFASKADGQAFIEAVTGRSRKEIGWELISHEWALVGLDRDDQFVHENPTGGAVGVVKGADRV